LTKTTNAFITFFVSVENVYYIYAGKYVISLIAFSDND